MSPRPRPRIGECTGRNAARRTAALAAACTVLAAATAAAQVPPAGPRVSSYHFTIDLPDSGGEIRGSAAIRLAGPGRSGDTLRLDLVGMSVDGAVDAATSRPIPFAYDGRTIVVPVAEQPVYSSASPALRVDWHGTPHDGLIIEANARGRWAAFGDDWPQRARAWIPTVDDPAHKAAVRWTITAPARLRVVANGRLEGRASAGAGRTTWTYVERHPIPTYTMVLGATEMTVSTHRPLIAGGDTIPMEVWTYPEDSAFADSTPFRRLTEVVETLQRIIGPFPYEKLAHVQSATRYGGMENSSAIFYAEQMYVRRTMREGVVRHETAHQWFGDAVTERDFHHLWLSEGFASYFDLVAGAMLDDDTVLARGMRADAESYMHSDVVGRPILDTTVTELTQLLDANSYQKGAWVLHMLRGYVGDTAFFTGIRDYYRTWRDSSVLSEDFEHVMERASGKPLGWFFDQWLRQPGYPKLDVTWRWDAAVREVVLEVAQVQPAAWGTFRLPDVVVELLDGSRVLARQVVELSGARQALRLAASAPPTGVRVDPDGALLLAATVRRGPP